MFTRWCVADTRRVCFDINKWRQASGTRSTARLSVEFLSPSHTIRGSSILIYPSWSRGVTLSSTLLSFAFTRRLTWHFRPLFRFRQKCDDFYKNLTIERGNWKFRCTRTMGATRSIVESNGGWPWPVFATTVCRERTNDEFRTFF